LLQINPDLWIWISWVKFFSEYINYRKKQLKTLWSLKVPIDCTDLLIKKLIFKSVLTPTLHKNHNLDYYDSITFE